jgi:peptide/nickel transport system substrate-binding protein
VLAGAILLGCAPAREGPGSRLGPGDAEANRASASARPLQIGLFQEPGILGGKFGGGGTGIADYEFLFGARLVHYDHLGNPVAVLSREVPSLDKGTWRLIDDGRMETTHRLRQGATWHDGLPFTAQDVTFTWQTIMNPELPAENREPEKFIDAIQALDDLTFMVHWKEPYIFANAWDLVPTPRHILEPLAQRDPQAFANAGYWTRDWVGLGPYRLMDWVQGSHLKGQAFRNYVLGASTGNPSLRPLGTCGCGKG